MGQSEESAAEHPTEMPVVQVCGPLKQAAEERVRATCQQPMPVVGNWRRGLSDVKSGEWRQRRATSCWAPAALVAGRDRCRALAAFSSIRATGLVCSINSTLQCKVNQTTMTRTATATVQEQKPQRPLNRSLILDRAVVLIEDEGPGALTMRRLGSSLGVEAMAIYHHFAGRDELLSAIGDRLLEPLHDLELGDSWREACRRFAIALRGVAVARPATFALLGLQPFDTPSSLGPVERLLGVLVAAGFTPAPALAVYRATVSYARGYALAEATGFTVDASQPDGRRRLAALPKVEFPILAGRARELVALDADAAYEVGLQALLTGFADPKVVEHTGGKSKGRVPLPPGPPG